MSNGYIQLPRSIMDEEFYFQERFTRAQAYIDLFSVAAYTERTFRIRGNLVTIQRGQVATSENNLAIRWGWSRNTVRKFLEQLVKDGKIEQQKSRIINKISLKDYYHVEQQNEQQVEQQNEQPIINEKKGKQKKDSELSQKDFSQKKAPDFVAMDFAEIYLEWMRYRDEIGKPYTSDTARRAFYDSLVECSGGNPDKARLIIKKSIANGWRDIYELKQDNNGYSNRRTNYWPTTKDNVEDAQQAAIARMHAVIASAD